MTTSSNKNGYNIKVYTDGSCSKPQGPGAWAYLIVCEDGSSVEYTKGSKCTTNNRMELEGPIEALKSIQEPSKITIISDSKYVTNGINDWIYKWHQNGWKRKQNDRLVKLANEDLWKKMYDLIQFHKVKAEWVKGHNAHPENERCNKLAIEEMRKQKEQ
jgi:ribonuclease HI